MKKSRIMVCAPLSSDFVYSQSSVDAMLLLINPLRMRSRVTVVCLSLVYQTTPSPSTGCIASPARGREGLATLARFAWQSGMQ